MALSSPLHLHECLAHLVSFEKFDEGFGRVFDSFSDGFLPHDAAVADPCAHLLLEFWLEILMVAHDEALPPDPLADDLE